MLENATKVNRINIFSFIFLFCLNNINNPRPEPVNNPDIQLPNGSIFSNYNSVIDFGTNLDFSVKRRFAIRHFANHW